LPREKGSAQRDVVRSAIHANDRLRRARAAQATDAMRCSAFVRILGEPDDHTRHARLP
jgi:hypothetical protein